MNLVSDNKGLNLDVITKASSGADLESQTSKFLGLSVSKMALTQNRRPLFICLKDF